MARNTACMLATIVTLLVAVETVIWFSSPEDSVTGQPARADELESLVPEISEPTANDIRLAREFLRTGPPFKYRFRQEAEWVPIKIKETGADEQSLIRGAVGLLRDGTDDEKCRSLDFLSLFGDKVPTQPILDVISNSKNSYVRNRAISSLTKIGYTGEDIRNKLFELRATDLSIDVRVQAACALGLTDNPETIAVLEAGARSKKCNPRTRLFCEDRLVNMGRLVLPLPDEMYETITKEEYFKFLSENGDGYIVHRKTRKNGFIYLEVIEKNIHAPESYWLCNWYRIEEKKITDEPPGKSPQLPDTSRSK
jgi:hypothetical protein